MGMNFRTQRDGHDRAGYIEAKPGFWSAMAFRYRLATHAERLAIEDAQKGANSAQRSAIVREAIASHLTWWDQKDSRGAELPRTAEILHTCDNSFLIDRLFNIIQGWELPDEKPNEGPTADDKPFDPAAAIASQLEGVAVGDLQTERDEKN